MRHLKPHPYRLRFLQLDRFSRAAFLFLFTTTVTVAEAPAPTVNRATTEPGQPLPKSVAREILEIQQRLGGSIVTDRDALREIAPFSAADHAEVSDYPEALAQFISDFSAGQSAAKNCSQAAEMVESLRDAAWQLDQSAENLERSDLYQQADALRNLAQQFRIEARAARAQSSD